MKEKQNNNKKTSQRMPKKNKFTRKSERRRKLTMYERYIKRSLDFVCALIGIVVLSPVMLVVAVLVRVKLGKPVIFIQERPGKDEKIFKLYKFRSMSDKRDKDGKLLPDVERLGKFGKTLRATSLDELPELYNILKGDMSVVGPRPLLVKDIVFMSNRHRKRHKILPGLTGLAQVSGRNSISWEKKLDYDLKYAKKITFLGDLKIVLKTITEILINQDGITEEGMATATDYGDYLLNCGKVSKEFYIQKQIESEMILSKLNSEMRK